MSLELFSAQNPANILIVDDEPKIGELFSEYLKNDRINSVICKSSQEAWQLIDKYKFDIIITDLKMPLIGGYELIEIIRNSELNSDVPVILCSGFIDKATFANLSLVNKIYYLDKPLRRADLFEQIDKILQVKKKVLPVNIEITTLFQTTFSEYLEKNIDDTAISWNELDEFNADTGIEYSTILTWAGSKFKTEAFISIDEKTFLEIVSLIQGIKYMHLDEEAHTIYYGFMAGFAKTLAKKLQSIDPGTFFANPVNQRLQSYNFFSADYHLAKYWSVPTKIGTVKIRFSSVKA